MRISKIKVASLLLSWSPFIMYSRTDVVAVVCVDDWRVRVVGVSALSGISQVILSARAVHCEAGQFQKGGAKICWGDL